MSVELPMLVDHCCPVRVLSEEQTCLTVQAVTTDLLPYMALGFSLREGEEGLLIDEQYSVEAEISCQ